MRATINEYRYMLWILRRFEGWGCLRWPLAAVSVLLAVWAVPFAGGVGSYYVARSGHSLPVVALSVLVTLGLGGIGTAWSRRRPWYQLIHTRVQGYAEQSSPNEYAYALIPTEDYSRACAALWRAGLNDRSRSTGPIPDAPGLDTSMFIFRTRNAARPGQSTVEETAMRVLRAAGVRGRVNSGTLTDPDLDIRSGAKERQPVTPIAS